MYHRHLIVLSVLIFMPLSLQAKSRHQHQKAPVVRHTKAEMQIDLNEASVTRLTHAFKGLGQKRAEAIVAWRKAYHGFKNIDDLAKVKGFGPAFMKRHARQINRIFVVHTRGKHE